MIALDEYLPIMYGKHPNAVSAHSNALNTGQLHLQEWSKHFSTRDTLKAYSFWPFLIRPTHYTYEPDYITDTESSAVIDLTRLQEVS